MSGTRSQDTTPHTKRRKSRLAVIVGSLVVIAGCIVVRYYWGAEPASANPQSSRPAARPLSPQTRTPKAPSPKAGAADRPSRLKTVAVVNGRQITREVLGRECLRCYGELVLESLINKFLISQECQRRGITITRADVDAEITRMAQRFSIPREEWLKMLQKERGISPTQYANDLIWPILALRRLAGKQLDVTPRELRDEYDAKYGAAIDARIIACKTEEIARQVRAHALAHPDQFSKLAKQYSEDAPSASAGGRIPPIRKHSTYSQVEQAAFSMKDGDISQVIPVGGQYVILQRNQELPAAKVANYEQVAPKLKEFVRDKKLRLVAKDIFAQLQEQVQVVNVMNDPLKSRAMPGVAATVNGRPIAIDQLAEACVERHGKEVLEGTVNRTLIELACEKRKITVSDAEIDAEIARAAADSVPLKDGKPDLQAWTELVTEQQGVSVEVYRRDAVWPSIALKKLVGNSVKVSDEDLKKGYEANYGRRVRCRAIVLNDLRRAQRVWGLAADKPTLEYFGRLAEEYSIEPGSRALRGEVPPIKQHGGQPQLEKEAFSLEPGELSSVVQLGGRYVILFCEGYTKPVEVDFAAVRDLIYEDIHEKKMRSAMAKYFNHLKDTATIDNYLAGTTRRPKPTAGPTPPTNLPQLRQIPSQR